jgi:hypothetical protein
MTSNPKKSGSGRGVFSCLVLEFLYGKTHQNNMGALILNYLTIYYV